MPPSMTGFKPFGIPFQKDEVLNLLFEEWEAVRLLDYEGLLQEEAAARLNVSRPTLTRIYERARKTIARALVEGRPFVVKGGDVQFDAVWVQCNDCFIRYMAGDGEQQCPKCRSKNVSVMTETVDTTGCAPQKGKFNCICPGCNYKQLHKRGVPCMEEHCPKCGKAMMREHSYHHQQLIKKQNKEDKQ